MTDRELLQAIDAIECDMRHLEGRLTSIRSRIYAKSGLERMRIGMDGHPKKRPEPDGDGAGSRDPMGL